MLAVIPHKKALKLKPDSSRLFPEQDFSLKRDRYTAWYRRTP